MGNFKFIADTIKGSSISIDKDGIKVTRAFFLSGLTQGGRTTRPFFALNYPLVPVINAYHPTIPFLRVINKTYEAIDSQTFRVFCNYEKLNAGDEEDQSQLAQVRFSGTLVNTQTTKAIGLDGAIFDMVLTPTAGSNPDGDPLPEQPVIGDVQVPIFSVEYTRKENTSPQGRQSEFVGKINSVAFAGYAVKTVLCSAIVANSNDGGQTYTTNYIFSVKPSTWDIFAVYQDPTTGAPIPNPSIGNGTKLDYTVYEVADFSQLGLT